MNDKFKIKKDQLKLLTITCLVLSVVITIFHNMNINFYFKNIIIPFTALTLGYIFMIKKNDLEVNKKAYIMLIPIFLILMSDLIVKIDMSNKVLNVFILPVLLSSFFLLLINKGYMITRYALVVIFKLFPKGLIKNLGSIKDLKREVKNKKSNKFMNILHGFIIGTPIALILLFLLANADKYFGEFVSFITTFVSSIFKIDYLFSNILILSASFIILFSLFVNILKNKNLKLNDIVYKEVNSTISATVLSIINFVFILFLISEISKLTNNFLRLPIEYTYAQYAREGFFQLLMVSSINFGVLLFFIYESEIIKKSRIIKNLLLLLSAFSIMLIFNSYYRMFLYMHAYGLTILRLQVILFLTMELVLFSIILKKIISKLKNNDAILFMTVSLFFYILNLYLCTKDFIRLIN